MPNILDEYLVKLGAVVDQSGIARFQQALREASAAVDASMVGMAQASFKAYTEIVSGFVAIGTSALGLADKVAMADQEYRLFALHMYMSKDAARSLKVAMDALGQPLENLMWDAELRERTRQLIADQRAMAEGGDFNDQMKKIRDLRFEFTRMEVEVKYFGMRIVTDFMRSMGVGPDWLLGKLRSLNDWIIGNLPALAKKFVTWFMPIWTDTKMVLTSVWQIIRELGKAFTNLMGVIFLDPELESGTFSWQKFGMALEYVAAVAATVATSVSIIVDVIARLVSVIGELITLRWDKIPDELKGLYEDVGTDWSNFKTLSLQMAQSRADLLGTKSGSDVSSLIDQQAAAQGVSPTLLHALTSQESGGRMYDAAGRVITSVKGAIGPMQLMPGTAKSLGVDPYNVAQNVAGGARYLGQLLRRYGGNVPEALGAYNAGPGRMDAFLAGKATLPAETKNYIASILARAGAVGNVQVGSIVITVTQPGASAEHIAGKVMEKQREEVNKQTQRNLQEFASVSWSF